MHLLRLQALSVLPHLVKRFFGALDPRGPGVEDERWAESVLVPTLVPLWRRMSGPDRRHAMGVAREVATSLGPSATTPVLAAALLHDVGKVEAGLGTLARVPATVVGQFGGRRRAAAWAALSGGMRRRLGLYLSHPAVGARLVGAAGADPLTVAWVAEHHLPETRWTVPHELASALKAADDD